MRTKIMFAGAAVALLAIPFISSAATLNDLQAQLASLLAQIQALQVQNGSSSSASVSTGGNASLSGEVVSSCPAFVRSLSVGSTGADVSSLQAFLDAHGYLNVSPTGYYGPLTAAAVGKWQVASGVITAGHAGYGVFGPLSRAYFARNCTGTSTTGNGGGTTGGSTSANFSASPTSGSAPLTVQFVETVPQGETLATNINYGDGSTGTLGVVPVCSSCNAEAAGTHTYTAAGTYNVTLTSGMCSCPANGICNCPNMMIVGTATVTVSGTSSGTTSSNNIQQLNAPGTVTLQQGGIAEIRNESYYFTLTSLTSDTATIQITPVGCWNSFPSDTPPEIHCMIAIVPIPPQTLSVGQSTSGNYTGAIQLTQDNGSSATFSVVNTSSQ